MISSKKSILFLVFSIFMVFPVYFIVLIGEDIRTGNWELLQPRLVYYLMSIWGTWIFTISIAVYHKWMEKKNLFFYLNYAFILLTMVFFMTFNAKLLDHIHNSSQTQDKEMLNLMRTGQHLVPLVLATIYLQASVWWFRKKWHRK